MASQEKVIEFLGDSLERLRDFPDDARQTAGYWLGEIQRGKTPLHYRPMPDVGSGVYELKIREASGQFRVFYVAKHKDAIYVLHCFQKKSQATVQHDIELGRTRYKEIP